ncbi:MAG: Deoxyribodipyrimidine photolyase PhrB [Candidatus Methanohalarchaeum thermophilum]|uniref:Deoxyribodipyrimidine photolyase PhrB n=1 Tax=Methanohalarchaeum thermophilum TaxID=1903181 RepID=A0A1Q6DW59_METT1|nr:MAG: Deoxyribodipyrimidine photolyase PhrB [Candidatus Methanohalarchaeum thermophilum]
MACIVWIRRSLRVNDNTSLIEASNEFDEIIPLYIIDKNILKKTENEKRIRFWYRALKDLKRQLMDNGADLLIKTGDPLQILKKQVDKKELEKIFFNRDYSHYAKKRDQKVRNKLDIPIKEFKDIVLSEKKEILNSNDKPYQAFSYYYKKWLDKNKRKPKKVSSFKTPNIENSSLPRLKQLENIEKTEKEIEIWKPTRKEGLTRLNEFMDKIGEYKEKGEYPNKGFTSKISPYLKFGKISIREAYWKAEEQKNTEKTEGVTEWQRQLAWRDFYFQILHNHPEIRKRAFKEKYSKIEWNKKEKWKSFKNAKTGYPVIDAGIRQLKNQGWIHNRLRMLITSFAAKDLYLDWKKLHKFYKKHFIDAEIASMLGGIQWCYSIGPSSQPYFRVFNPIKQSKKYDPKGKYIKRWLSELKDVPTDYIHEPHKTPKKIQSQIDLDIGKDYPQPIVDHKPRIKKAKKMYSRFN